MIGMVDKEYIRKRNLVDGWSIREIGKNCKVSRQTVRKMLQDAEIPKYQLNVPRPGRVMERWKPIIEAWIRDDEKPGVPKKQRHTANRIYERLCQEYGDEFTASESTVRYWVRRIRDNKPEAFVPLSADAGEVAEADFGHVVVKLNGIQTNVHLVLGSNGGHNESRM